MISLNAARRLVPGVKPRAQGVILAESAKLVVKLLDSRRDYLKVQKLRYDVFHREFQKKKFPFGLDRDRYDSQAEHLVVLDRASGKIVGSYRAIASTNPEDFYSGSEFDLRAFATVPGVKLELSRACIHRDYRNGAVLTMLWRGIGEYISRVDAKWLFGIPSVKSTNVEEVVQIYRYFQAMDRVAPIATVDPLLSHRLPGFLEALARAEAAGPLDQKAALAIVPPLFHVYIKAGCRVVGQPALDAAFGCVDFFMALRMDELNQLFKRKYVN